VPCPAARLLGQKSTRGWVTGKQALPPKTFAEGRPRSCSPRIQLNSTNGEQVELQMEARSSLLSRGDGALRCCRPTDPKRLAFTVEDINESNTNTPRRDPIRTDRRTLDTLVLTLICRDDVH